MRRLCYLCCLFLFATALNQSHLPRAAAQSAPSLPAHPRLWLTPATVTTLRTWAVATNPIYADGLLALAERAKTEMDEGRVPAEDCGQRGYTEFPTESYAQLFAFMSLIDPDPVAQKDYAQRARTLLMYVINLAAKGPVDESQQTQRCPGDPDSPAYPPFRDPRFFTEDSDRLRWQGVSFPLTVDWIYDSLTAQDKATIDRVFTRWGQEIIDRGYHHPEPVGSLEASVLKADRAQVRWAGNNYFTAHMRNLGMMSLALDPADSSPALQSYLSNANGAWLLLFDELTRSDARGGLLPEGFEYSPQTASYAIQYLLALKTANQADAVLNGPQTVLENNPFWDDFVKVFLHSLSPATTTDPDDGTTIYLPAWYGDAQRYHLSDFIDAFGALGVYDQLVGNASRLNTLRWIQINVPAGGAASLVDRVRGADYFRSAMLYFMLLDPAAPTPTDPRPALRTAYTASGMQRAFSRTDWTPQAAWFTYALSWNAIDHQMADGNHLEFYRNGEWLTKARTGYANIAEGIASSEFRNTLAIENTRPPEREDSDWRIDLWRRGSQWNLVAAGDPGPLLSSDAPTYTYVAGDATNLYNSTNESAMEVRHASRAVVWLKPDTFVVYDRADAPASRFKRVWWQLPARATVKGSLATMQTAAGQQLFITALAPAGATMRMVDKAQDQVDDTVARNETMTERLVVEAPALDQARFVHLVQGADAGAAPFASVLIRSTDGDAFEGASVNNTVVMFPVNAGQAFTALKFTAPLDTTRYVITGLVPETSYAVTLTTAAQGIEVEIKPASGGSQTDTAGVLAINP